MTGYDDAKEYAVSNSGNYKADPKTGMYQPQATKPTQQAMQTPPTKDLIQAMMTAYLRKSGKGYTSAAPTDIIQQTGAYDSQGAFGVPYSGISYAGSQKTGGYSNPYSAIFSPTPDNDSTGY